MKLVVVLLLIALALWVGCNTDPLAKLSKTESGQLTFASAFHITTSATRPIGMTHRQIDAQFSRNELFKPFKKDGPILGVPVSYSKKLEGIYAHVRSPEGYPWYEFEYFQDTCISLLFKDIKTGSAQVEGCVELFSTALGDPIYYRGDQYRTEQGTYIYDQDVDTYIWKDQGCTIIIRYRRQWNYYSLEMRDSAKYNLASAEIERIGFDPDEE